MENEIWKDIKGYGENYQVSNIGRVRKVTEDGKIKILAYKMQANRQTVRLRKKQDKRDYWCVIVAKLVADAFIPKDAEWQDYVEHIDGNNKNDVVWNLRWSKKTNKEICAEYSRIANLKCKNHVEIKDGIAYVELNNTKRIMMCNVEDWERNKNHTWNERYGYAKTITNKKEIAFHSMVKKCPEGYVIDHINRNRFDNRRDNLRITTQYVNSLNRTVSQLSSTGVKGVYKEKNKYRTEITIKGKKLYLGTYDTLEKAKQVRLQAEQKYYDPIIEKETLR